MIGLLLTIDIGNTNLTIGAYSGEELKFVSRLATDRSRTEDQYAIELKSIFDLYGVVFGTAAMLDGLCDRMEQELGRKVKSFVATGGLSGEIIKSCNHKMTYDPELILKGLRIIYEKNRK